MSSKNK